MTTARDIGTATGAFAADLSETEVNDAIARARAHLYFRQAPAGWWKGELRTNVTMDAEDLLLRQFLGILQPDDLEQAARWIRSQQRPDGTWANFTGGPADLSTTIEAYVALRLAGDELSAPHLAAARAHILDAGGIEASRVFTRVWLALFGEWSWDDLPAMPPELVLLPSWVPLNVYDWACWARQTVVPITVVATLRPVRPLPFSVSELRTGAAPSGRPGLVAGGFGLLDKALKVYHHAPVKPGRSWAMRQAAEWIVARQESDGGWGGIQPPWVYSILALHLLGYSLDHPVLAAAIDGLDGFLVREPTADGPIRRLEACQSPVWDTCLAVIALADADATVADAGLRQAVDWLLAEEIDVPGDWSVRRPNVAPAGWAFEFANDGYPDVDDTAEVVLALLRVRDDVPGVRAAIRRGVDWVVGMQSRDGGWAAFDADNTSATYREAAVLRLRGGDRSAVGRRHGTRRRDARPVRRGERAARAARHPLAARRAGERRFVVRAMGRELRLRHRRRGARAGRRGNRLRRRTDSAGRAVVGAASERRRRLG